MSKTRVGVVGVGHLGYHHARNYASLDGSCLIGVADPDIARGRKAAEDFGTQWFPSLEDLLEAGVDAVSIAAPTRMHHSLALQSLWAGVDVLVEKPLAATVSEAREIVDRAAEAGRVLQVGHIERFNGAVMALVGAVKAPRFIECHRLSPYPVRAVNAEGKTVGRGDDVSVVLDLMIHDLDIVLALAGPEIVQVDAVGVPVFSEFEDIANARLRWASGCVANLTCSRISVDRMRKIRVFEANSYLSTDYSEQAVQVYRKKPGPMPPDVSPMQWISIEPLPVQREEPLKRELASFVECVKTRQRPVVSGDDGLAALELAQRIIDSIGEFPEPDIV